MFRHRSPRQQRPVLRLRGLSLVAAMTLALVSLAPAPAGAAEQWYSGTIKQTLITNCPSIIFGSPYQENGIGAFASYWGDQQSNPISPAVGEMTYLNTYAMLLGSHCSTPFIFPKFLLPAGVTFDTTQPIQCYFTPPGGTQYRITDPRQCTQWSNVAADGRYTSTDPDWSTGWPLPSGPNFTNGSAWEFWVPIKATTQVWGAQLTTQLDIADGNSNSPLNLTVPFYTGPPAVTVPGSPTNVTATPTSPTSAQVTFSPPASNGGAPITGYTAQCVSGDGGATGTVSGTSSPISVGSLTTGRTYRCQVRATNSVGAGAWSAWSAYFTLTAPTVPGKPGNVTATVASSTSASVSFSPPVSNGGSPITSYTARCVSTNGGITRAQTGASSPIQVQNLGGGRSYQCQVRATNGVGSGEFSPLTSTFTLPATRPDPPTGVTATGVSSTSARVSFSPPAWNGGSAITSYTARCASTNGGIARTKSGAGSPITVAYLTKGKSYQCQVRAANGVGVSTYSPLTSTFTLPPGVPDAPRNVTATRLSSTSARVSFSPPAWNGGSAITSYFARCVSSNGGITRTRSGAASPLTVGSLTSGKTYRCQVRATNAVGSGPFSSLTAPF